MDAKLVWIWSGVSMHLRRGCAIALLSPAIALPAMATESSASAVLLKTIDPVAPDSFKTASAEAAVFPSGTAVSEPTLMPVAIQNRSIAPAVQQSGVSRRYDEPKGTLGSVQKADEMEMAQEGQVVNPGQDVQGASAARELDQPSPIAQAQSEVRATSPVDPSVASLTALTPLELPRAELPPAAIVPAELAQVPLAQVTSVSQLSDVQPTDWSFQALQSLVERYGVVAGYPDGRFRGDRPLSRYEFAAGLNAAIDAIDRQVRSAAEAQPSREDLAILQRLSSDFAPELATLRGRADALEARTAELEANQFSTTAVLNGQVIFGLAAAGGGDPPGRGTGNVVLNHLTVLQLGASFTGRDALRVELTAGNFGNRGFANPRSLNTNMALLGYQSDTGNGVELDSLEYRFALGDRLVFMVKPVGFSLNSVLSSNSIFSSTSDGALSRFAAYNPIFRIGNLDAGVGFDYLLTRRLRLQVAYGARNAGEPEGGLFSSDHRALGIQLLARPTANLTTGIAYVNAFARDGRLDTFTGSNNADISGGIGEPSAIHALSGTLQWQITPGIVFSTWGGVIVTDSLPSNAVTLAATYLFSLGFPDPFGREGDLFGILVGQPPGSKTAF